MVVFLDLAEEGLDFYSHPGDGHGFPLSKPPPMTAKPRPLGVSNVIEYAHDFLTDSHPNSFSAALACYPVVVQIAQSLDLNSLHALSRTCRQFRSLLLQCHRQLLARSLRCQNELGRSQALIADGIRKLYISGNSPIEYVEMACFTTERTSTCARDLVSECRRCNAVVCRNCTTKPLSTSRLPGRHRRLCPTCLAAPLSMLTDPFTISTNPPAFTTNAFVRGPCKCREFMYLCRPCGHDITMRDTSYKRIWTWRTRYSTYLGGLGTGIGEGNEGVKCGRGENCLASKDTELEIDCSADGLSPLVWITPDTLRGEPTSDEAWIDAGEKAGYLAQEIEGIGGVVKKKAKKRVRIGRTVTEYEDERERAEYMAREMRGENRSWCDWCDRVIPSTADLSTPSLVN